MTPIDRILPLLNKVRRRQPGQWSACCPACNSNGPKLSVRESSSGSVLLHCFKGCAVSAIVSAVGLQLQDLFPPRDVPPGAPKRTPPLLTAPQALALLVDEFMIVGVAAGNIGHGVTLSKTDRERVLQAAGVINLLQDECKRGVYD